MLLQGVADQAAALQYASALSTSSATSALLFSIMQQLQATAVGLADTDHPCALFAAAAAQLIASFTSTADVQVQQQAPSLYTLSILGALEITILVAADDLADSGKQVLGTCLEAAVAGLIDASGAWGALPA